MASSPERRQAVSFRLRRDLVDRLRQHVRDHRGKPLYMELAAFLERAIEREIERTSLIAAGALPADPPHEASRNPVAERHTVLGPINHTPATSGPHGCLHR